MKPSATTAINNISELLRRLEKSYPEAHCYLDHKNPYELLVATTLSAQCTDERVNIVTQALFQKYPTPELMAKAKIESIEKLIYSTGFYKNKAKSLKECAITLVKIYDSEVPKTMAELVQLPGVGRKTANVVLGNAFSNPDGVVVDTHVSRISQRLGLAKEKTPEKIEIELNKLVPLKRWTIFSHWLIAHGRAICQARKPKCDQCPLLDLCPKRGI